MRYYSNRIEWETFLSSKVDVLLLCGEMGKNLKADEQNPEKKVNFSHQNQSLNINVPGMRRFSSGLELSLEVNKS